MLNYIDNILNKITMYRLVLYVLIVIWLGTIVQEIFVPSYGIWNIVYSMLVIVSSCLVTNFVFAKLWKIPKNAESDYITGLILSLIVTPGSPMVFLILVGVISQASKYVLAIRGKHIFNPAAIAVIITTLSISQGASWWVGSVYLFPVVLVGGLLVSRKTQRFHLVLSFLLAYLGLLMFIGGTSYMSGLWMSPIWFFAFIMVTEPMTSPTTRNSRLLFGILVAVIFVFVPDIGPIYQSPELALVLGNIFAFAIGDKGRYKLMLKSKTEIAADIYDFTFEPSRKLKFLPGQYMDWTLGLPKSDTRGNRRYFTIASSPTENIVKLGVKLYEPPSAFKSKLKSLNVGDILFGGHISGDFVLPEDKFQKLVFIAGGIGITPFRSMIQFLIDQNEKRDIVLFYSVKVENEIAYREIFDQASLAGVNVVYIVTDRDGFLDADKIKAKVPDFIDRKFYVSGPRGMVVAFEKSLKIMGLAKKQIKVDFFPGYA